jgi:hypothetical protein
VESRVDGNTVGLSSLSFVKYQGGSSVVQSRVDREMWVEARGFKRSTSESHCSQVCRHWREQCECSIVYLTKKKLSGLEQRNVSVFVYWKAAEVCA